MKNRAVFLDRDGTINEDFGFVHEVERFKFIPGSIEGLQLISRKGYKVIVVTNQSGIGRGYYTEEDFRRVKEYMLEELAKHYITIDHIYYCPHNPKDKCECRKPKVKFIKEAEKRFNLDLQKCYVVGDKTADIKMGENAGCKTILVRTGEAGKDGKFKIKADFTVGNLREAADIMEDET
jgi:D-glycero-D-manno-heptose 1,7-bisphosphate phosphatase